MRILLVLTLLTLVRHPASAQSVRDSAGIRIVENARPLWSGTQGWTVDPRPAFRAEVQSGPACGGGGECVTRQAVAGLSRLSDGRIVLLNGGTLQLVFYDPSGAPPRMVGREGEGPGEFQDPRHLYRGRGDTLYVDDNRTVSSFSADGRFLRRTPYRIPSGTPGALVTDIQAVFDDGRMVLTNRGATSAPAPQGGEGSKLLWTVPAYILARDGTLLQTISGLPAAEFAVREGRNRLDLFAARNARASDGRVFWYGYPTTYQLTAYNSDGRAVRIIRRSMQPAEVTRGDIDAYKQERREAVMAMGPAADRAALNRALDALTFATHYPAFARALASRSGYLWVQEWTRPGGGGFDPIGSLRWSVFDPEGRWLGVVTLPAGLQVFEFGDDYILGVTRDSDDLEFVTLYRLVHG